eukprot:360688-Chlamydomonas_euryale.AAC.4
MRRVVASASSSQAWNGAVAGTRCVVTSWKTAANCSFPWLWVFGKRRGVGRLEMAWRGLGGHVGGPGVRAMHVHLQCV